MIEIQNRQQLTQNGQTPELQKSRDLALQSLQYAVNAVEPKQLLNAKIKVQNDTLHVENSKFTLSDFAHVYVVGGGKASGKMAQALEELLRARLTGGAVNVPYGTKHETSVIELHEASHPVPDQNGVEGTKQIVRIAERAGADDLVICLISGGGSSLMPLPRKGISLTDKQDITSALLKSGAPIAQVNIVRKHLSEFKGGWLAKKAYPATVLNLVLSDVMGDSLDSIASGPTVPDNSTFSDAKAVLEKYGLWDNVSVSIHKSILDGIASKIEETPKPNDTAFEKVYNLIIGNNKTAVTAAVEYLSSKGLNTVLLPNLLEGEAREVGAALAQFFCSSKSPFPKPVGIVVGGETTVTVKGKGKGGRNQELALSAALNLSELEECVIAAFSTDGVDGPTDAAGAVVDGYTVKRAKKRRLNPKLFLAENDSYDFFEQIGDLIMTGATSTNVNDLCVIVAL
ncbi:MAG: glycerate kinase [Candidatus Bathyarchaeota archaeon]|nr:glycerate kinase [Candidatus Bathyarchaeota archaeon]